MSSASMISENTEAIVKAIRVAVTKQSEVQTEGTSFKKVGPVVAAMVCTAADLIVDTAKTGGVPTPAHATVFIINRVAGFAGLSENQKILCVAALAELATTVATDGVLLLASSTAEAGTGGAASPISIPLMISSGASLALAGLKTSQQCGPLVMKKITSLNEEAFKIYIQANQYIGNPAL